MSDYAEFARREQAGWSDGSKVEAYVAKFGPITAAAGEALVDRLDPHGDVLDLCCGHGELTARLTSRGALVTGLDFSVEMLNRAAVGAPAARFVEGDAAEMPFNDGSFDHVLCGFGMMHLPDQPAALREIRRVLRPRGQFGMATWAGPAVSPAFGLVFGAIRAHGDLSGAPAQPDLFAFAEPERAVEMLEEAGLTMLDHDVFTPAWELETPDGLFDIFLTATVGAAMLIKSQTPEAISAIRNDVAARVETDHAENGGYRVPVAVSVVTAEAA